MTRRMIDYGYESADGVLKLAATRVGKRWDVTQASLDRWAALTDAATLASVLATIDRKTAAWAAEPVPAFGFVQIDNWQTGELRRSLDRLEAAGHLACEVVRCKSSGIPWRTYWRPGQPPIGSCAASGTAAEARTDA